VKVNVFFDARILIESFFAKNRRAGLYFVTWNVLKNMQENKNLHITLAYPLEYEGSILLRKIKKNPYFSQFEFACSGGAELSAFFLSSDIQKHRKEKNHIKKLGCYLRLFQLKAKEKLYSDKEKFKDVHIYFSSFYAIPKKILEQEHIKKFYMLHDVIPIIFNDKLGIQRLSTIINTFDKNMYFFCVSQSCKDDFLKYCGDKLDANKMFVTHNATNQNYIPNYNKQELVQVLKKYNVNHNPNDKYLFSLCNLEPRKNLPFTISCFLKFIKKHNIQDLYFYLGGSIWKKFRSVMAKTLDEAGIYRDKIKLLGYIEDSDVNALYSNSLFFTFLSQYEGFGMPPLEAMQAGTPVIASNNSSLPEVVGDAAISLTYNDEAAVIKAFEDFYFNEDLRKEYIARGLERAKMFSWEKCVGRMMDVMEKV